MMGELFVTAEDDARRNRDVVFKCSPIKLLYTNRMRQLYPKEITTLAFMNQSTRRQTGFEKCYMRLLPFIQQFTKLFKVVVITIKRQVVRQAKLNRNTAGECR